ncbi:MAG: HAMP domain-containing histidine kinase [Dehalobacter sp. 4CP]|uniref:sensor histidine kinase n=1 Tax=Dehalobacter sp. CP TaxID=2594474 RepID=UPI0013C78245|nr:HAMP domain-containing histidine kinase [Dehalobacter sp. 4CP]
MNLKRRLIAANTATVVIPVLITALVAMAYLFIYSKLYGNIYSWESYQRASQIEAILMDTERLIQQESPDAIADEKFQRLLRQKIAEIGGELIILKDDSMIYTSLDASEIGKIELAKALEAGQNKPGKETIVISSQSFTIQIIDQDPADAAGGTVLLLVPPDQAANGLIQFLIVIGLTFLCSFIVTNILISYQFSRTVLQPLNHLQHAADEIRTGNLDCQIAEEGDREIEALCRDLELMRLKLKESIQTQLKYEDNRKMLISSISHDLKTPVTSIKGYVEGILDGVANTPEKTEKYLRTIYVKAEQVDKMIDDLLLYAKLDLNQIPFNFKRTDVQEFIRSCLLESEPELENNGIHMEMFSDLTQKRCVLLDRERMKRIVMNILDNSRKYMDKDQAVIRVLLRETPSSIIMEFQDNGCGVSEKDLPYIFDRFYRSDQARTGIEGSGLGLAIAKQVVEGHQGIIWAMPHGKEGMSILISLAYLKDEYHVNLEST